MGQTDEPAHRIWESGSGRRERGGASSRARILTSLAAALLDPLWVCDVVVTSFAVEKCSKSDAWTAFRSGRRERGAARRSRTDGRTDGLPLHFFGVAGDKEAQCSLLHFDVVARVDEDAGWRQRHTENRHAC